MDSKKFLFVLSHAKSNIKEVIVMLKIISNMKAFDDDVEIAVFLVGEGVELAKKGVGKAMTMELEGNEVNGRRAAGNDARVQCEVLRLPRIHADA